MRDKPGAEKIGKRKFTDDPSPLLLHNE